MSTTHSTDMQFAAGLVAAAIMKEASVSSGHRRLLLRTHLDVSPEDVFYALSAELSPAPDVTVGGGSAPIGLHGIALPGDSPAERRLLIPYLVGRPGRNAGSAGFAALLRDEVPTGAGQKVLLILDRSPVETVRTAAQDAAVLPALRWSALVEAAVHGAASGVAELVRIVIDDDRKFSCLPRTAEVLGSLRRIAGLSSTSEAGQELSSLECYLSDPQARADGKRLRKSAAWRKKLDDWFTPGQDFTGKVTALYTSSASPGLHQVLNAVTPFGLDYRAFTLDDLPDGRRPVRSLRLAHPLSPGEPAQVVLGSRAMIWKPGGGVITLALASPAGADTAVTCKWSDDATIRDIVVRKNEREVRVEVTGHGWRFARVEAEVGQAAELAIYLDAGMWAPFDAGLDLDLNAGAFRCGTEPRVLALGRAGELRGDPAITRPGTVAEAGQTELCRAALAGEEHMIPLILDNAPMPGRPDHDPFGPAPEYEPETDTDGENPREQEDPETDDGEGPGYEPGPGFDPAPWIDTFQTAGVEPSVAHAKLTAWKSGETPGPAQFRVSTGGIPARKGVIALPRLFDLSSQDLGDGIDGLELEQHILDHPHTTAFTMARHSGTITLQPHPFLEQLAVSGISGVDAFHHARQELFAALRPQGSVHAIAAGTGIAEAKAYIETYSTLLQTLSDSGRFTAEYERLFLCDVVADAVSGELLIAPTSPLSVAYLLALSEQFAAWQPRAKHVIDQDIRSCSMRHLVPYFVLQGEWYETGAAAPLLWRRYRPSAVGVTSDHRPAYIARRIEHFAKVHPEYYDERQTLGLAFHEPGDGAAVLSALRTLAAPYATANAKQPLPRLAVTIVSTSTAPSAVEELVTGQIISSETQAATDDLLRDRVEVSRVEPSDAPPFAHLSFVFESSLRRQPAIVDLTARAGTLFVGGLAAAPGRHIEPGRNETTFMWGTFTGETGSNQLTGLVRKYLELVSGMPGDPITRGHTRMPSTRVGRTFLDNLYADSAWVVHLDKLLGLEAFAPDASGRHARYLIDYEDRLDVTQPGLDAITATSRIEPYRKALRQALTNFGTPAEPGLDRLLQIFNGVSGQWALDLVGANPNELRERIGLAGAVAAINDLDGGLHSDDAAGVIIPLDEMLHALPPQARPTKDRLCDDLLYIRVPTGTSGHVVLRGRLLEVKYRGATDARAPETARAQLQRANSWLASTFGDTAAPSHTFRARDLSELIRAAATRLAAFGLMDQQQRAQLEPALESISRSNFTLRLDYQAGTEKIHGDFVSIEADSNVAVHRQLLAGTGTMLGHLRLGRPFLEALAAGTTITRPASLATVTFSDSPSSGTPVPATPVTEVHAEVSPADKPRPEAPQPHTVNAAAVPAAEISLYSQRLDQAFTKYGLAVEPFRQELAQVGPSLIRFRTRILGKLSITDVERRARDLGREIAAPGEIGIADEPGFITIDVPRTHRDTVPIGAVLPSLDAAPAKPGALNFVAGVAPSGTVEVADLSRLPHLLVAGATGSGKSVFLRGLLTELLRARTPEQLHLLIVDPKRLDFAAFARIPHLHGQPIISDPDDALEALTYVLDRELARRQPILEEAGVSSAAEYYEGGGRLEDLPQLVILMDEFADLVLAGTDPKAFSKLIQRYAQLTRAYGIFLVLATQRPSVDVITGSIKANLSARIAFSLPSATDSRTVLDRGGAEDLLGDGDMLFYRNGRVERLQAPNTTGADVRTLLS